MASSAPRRFADLDTVPKRMLAPIDGYQNMPLVSLEEAIQPLVDIVPNVQRNVFIVKQNCRKPGDGLTSDESASILLYTLESNPPEHSLYVILNATLRAEQRQKLKPWFLYLRLILTALARLPSQRRYIFRGVREDLRDQYPIGESCIWWGFSSCTSSIGVLEYDSFFGRTGTRTLFNIDCLTGKNIKNHSFTQQEDEILLLPARQFMVTSSLDSGNGLHIIQLKEMEPMFPLLEPVSLPTPTLQPKTNQSSPSSAQQPILSKSSMFTINLSATARWSENGFIVAGGHGRGHAPNQLSHPYGLEVDQEGTIVIVDYCNHRVVEWRRSDTSGRVVAGGNGPGDRPDQLNWPTDVIIDKESDSLIICDRGNRRVTRWSRQNGVQCGETILDNIVCRGLAMDNQGSLYVTNAEKHEVRRYRRGEADGMVVAGGNGQGASLHQLNDPLYICVDEDHALYVSDFGNHRVMKWLKGAKEGIVVAGGQGEGKGMTQLYGPRGLMVDGAGTVYVADWGNHRVVRWRRGATQGTTVLARNRLGEEKNQLTYPGGLCFDQQGNMYVAVEDNHLVQRFAIEKN